MCCPGLSEPGLPGYASLSRPASPHLKPANEAKVSEASQLIMDQQHHRAETKPLLFDPLNEPSRE